MKLSLERINKNILLIGLVLLLFRNSSFALTFIPKPFEVCFMLVMMLAFVDIVMHNKWKEFFRSLPKKIWIAIALMLFSIALGWGMAVFFRGLPIIPNMYFELGAFLVAASTGILVLFYSRNDPTYVKKCLYALLAPVFYTLFITVPEVAYFFNLAGDGAFHGFTDNVGIISKALLIPAMFATVYALYPHNNRWRRIGYIVAAAALVAMIMWTTQRAAVLSYLIGAIVVWVIISWTSRQWKHAFINGSILVAIVIGGFLLIPAEGKKSAIDRGLHFDGNQTGYFNLKDKTVAQVLWESVLPEAATSESDLTDSQKSPEPRFQIWEHYLNIALRNPLGLGPNTHMEAKIPYAKGTFINTGPHNTYLEMWLWGGLLGLFSFLFILRTAFMGLLHQCFKKDMQPMTLILLGSLISLSLAMFFNDNLPFIWFWVILALALRYETTTR